MTNLKLYGILLAFLIIGIIMTFVPIYDSVHLLNAIERHSDIIVFEKGSYYLLGGGLLFTIGITWIFYLLLFTNEKGKTTQQVDKAYTQRIQRNTYIFIAVCMSTMFILPHIVSIGVGDYLENRGYTYCDKLSRQWLFNRTMVYTKNTCDKDVSD